MSKNLSIYIHIPFCDSKCYYCAFCSGKFSEDKDKYFNFLKDEIKERSKFTREYIVNTIYIGGGTPSSVDIKYIQDIVSLLYSCYNISNDCEFTIEINPCSCTKEKLLKYKELKINRISFGVQSLDDNLLKSIGRKHSSKQAISSIKLAKECGFKNISADMLIGLPNQTNEILLQDIDKLIELDVKHLSCYMLMIEDGTKMKNIFDTCSQIFPSEDECVSMYNSVFNHLKKRGYHRYEISNFSLENFESRHNQCYWRLGEYLGFGISAHSYFNGQRIANPSTFLEYYHNIQIIEDISLEESIEEYIMLGLRTEKGIDLDVLKSQFNHDLLIKKADKIDMLLKKGIVNIKDNFLSISDNYFGVSNKIILDLI